MPKFVKTSKLIIIGFLGFSAFYLFMFRRTHILRVATDFKNIDKKQQPAAKIFDVNDRKVKLPNCVKPANAESHIICDSLPFQTPMCRNNTEDTGLVPNIVHYIWIGNGTLKFFQYLSILSVATNHKPDKIIFHINDVVPQGELWLNLVAQIPCLETRKFEAPTHIYSNQITDVYMQTDVARFQIVLKQGGIYLDSDVIVVASLDPLRQYPFTMGFDGLNSLTNGAFLTKPNAAFLQEILNGYTSPSGFTEPVHYYACIRPRDLALRRKDLPIHIEETSMQRPNLWIEHASVAESSYDLSNNYMIHMHPKDTVKHFSRDFLEWGIDEVRIHDSTYGAAARAALFGTRDLVFLRGEEEIAKDRKPKKTIKLVVHNEGEKQHRNFVRTTLRELRKVSKYFRNLTKTD